EEQEPDLCPFAVLQHEEEHHDEQDPGDDQLRARALATLDPVLAARVAVLAHVLVSAHVAPPRRSSPAASGLTSSAQSCIIGRRGSREVRVGGRAGGRRVRDRAGRDHRPGRPGGRPRALQGREPRVRPASRPCLHRGDGAPVLPRRGGRRRRAGLRALGAATATWLLLQGIKRVVDRPRPADADPQGTRTLIARPNGTSWPSSHPAVLTTFTRVAARDLGLRPSSRAALTALDLTVAVSRVSVGVHYPSDVASGLLLGRAVARVWPRGRR